MTESFFGGLMYRDSIVDVKRLQCNNQLCTNGPWSERQRVDRIDTTRLALLSNYATAVKSIDGPLLLSGCPLLAEAPLALGSGAGLRWRRKLASDEVADEYTVLPSCMHFGGTSATLSLSPVTRYFSWLIRRTRALPSPQHILAIGTSFVEATSWFHFYTR